MKPVATFSVRVVDMNERTLTTFLVCDTDERRAMRRVWEAVYRSRELRRPSRAILCEWVGMADADAAPRRLDLRTPAGDDAAP